MTKPDDLWTLNIRPLLKALARASAAAIIAGVLPIDIIAMPASFLGVFILSVARDAKLSSKILNAMSTPKRARQAVSTKHGDAQ